MRGLFEVGLRCQNLGKGAGGFFQQCGAGGEVGLLREQRHAGAGMAGYFAKVGLITACEYADEGGFAAAVGPDYAYTFAVVNLESDALEKWVAVETTGEIAGTE